MNDCRQNVPWTFSEPAAENDGIPNLPTPEGRALGAELARLCDIEEARLRERYRRCGDCALRLGTDPNGCAETLMDFLKCVVESVPFYCHKAMADGEPRILCAGYAALASTDLAAAIELRGPTPEGAELIDRAHSCRGLGGSSLQVRGLLDEVES